LRSAATSSTVFSPGGADDVGGGPLRVSAVRKPRSRRQRSAASRLTVNRTHASGAGCAATVSHLRQARAYASCTASCASPRSPTAATAYRSVRTAVAR
jgi:hypothetical protein